LEDLLEIMGLLEVMVEAFRAGTHLGLDRENSMQTVGVAMLKQAGAK